MITIICGEDVIASRNYFSALKKQYTDKGYEIRDIGYSDIEKVSKWLGESVSLFSQKKIFFSENLNKYVRRDSKKTVDELTKIDKMKDVELIDWERVSLRELKLAKFGKVKEFKPNQTIFKLLDSFYPGNKIAFVKFLEVLKEIDDQFIFIMLVKHVRNLILVKEGETPARMQSWQLYKFKSLATHWKIENLVNFYEALLRIDIAAKSSSSPYSVREALAILACHFL